MVLDGAAAGIPTFAAGVAAVDAESFVGEVRTAGEAVV